MGLLPDWQYDEATKQLERAIELRPEDPTINDHLGEPIGEWAAYWRPNSSGRRGDSSPMPEELPKIEEKLKDGLPDETSSQAKAGRKSGDGG